VSEGIPAGRARRFDWRWRRVFSTPLPSKWISSLWSRAAARWLGEENSRILENDEPIPFETPEKLEEIVRGFKISHWSRHSQSYFDDQVRGEITTA
jgi:hypothetical protein